MHDGQMLNHQVYWLRVKAILDGIMERWKARWGREPYPGIHEYTWETPQQLATAVLSGYRAIEPGVPGRETHLVRSLVRGVGGFGRSSPGSMRACPKVPQMMPKKTLEKWTCAPAATLAIAAGA